MESIRENTEPREAKQTFRFIFANIIFESECKRSLIELYSRVDPYCFAFFSSINASETRKIDTIQEFAELARLWKLNYIPTDEFKSMIRNSEKSMLANIPVL